MNLDSADNGRVRADRSAKLQGGSAEPTTTLLRVLAGIADTFFSNVIQPYEEPAFWSFDERSARTRYHQVNNG
jgi:hypothetical protein